MPVHTSMGPLVLVAELQRCAQVALGMGCSLPHGVGTVSDLNLRGASFVGPGLAGVPLLSRAPRAGAGGVTALLPPLQCPTRRQDRTYVAAHDQGPGWERRIIGRAGLGGRLGAGSGSDALLWGRRGRNRETLTSRWAESTGRASRGEKSSTETNLPDRERGVRNDGVQDRTRPVMELDYLPKPEPPRRNPVPPAPSRHGGAGGRETPMKGRDARVASREGRRGKEGRGGRVGGWRGRRGAGEEGGGVTLGLGGLDLGVFQSSGGGEGAVGGLEWTAVEETVRERVEWEAVKGAVKPLPGRGGGEAALPGLQKLRWELSPWEIEMGFGLGPAQVAGTEQWGMGGSDVADEEAPPSLPGRWEKSQTPTAAPPLHKVGICVVPPVQTWPAIQEVRRQHDRHFERWPPHINLVYPLLLTDQELRDLPANLKTLLRDVPPFTVEMKSFRFFRHPLSCMLWAHPEKGGAELRRLQALIAAAYPPEAPSGTLGATSGGGVATVAGFGPEGVGGEGREGVEGEGGWVEGGFKDEGPGAGQYIPHLCLGQWKDEEEMRWAREELAARWPALRWEVQAVHLVSSVDRLAAPVQAARSQQLINASNVLPLRGSRGAEWPEPPPPRPAPFPASTPTPPPVAHEKAAGAQGGAGPTVGSDGTERVAGRAVDAAPGVWSLAAAQQGRGLLKWQRGGLYPEAEAARYREEQTRRIKGISLEREDGGARSARDVSEEGPPPDSGPWRGGRWRGRQWPLEPLEAAGAESGGGSTRTLMRALRVPSVPITEEEEDEEGVGEGDEEEGSAGAGSDGDIQGAPPPQP